MRFWLGLLLSGLLLSSEARAQFGVCNRAAGDAAFLVNRDADNRINVILNSPAPPHVKEAHITIINYNRQNALHTIQAGWAECNNGFRSPQQIVDAAVTIYTMGLNRMLPPGTMHVDVSEVMSGRPLGGPTAIVPQVRERILGGDRGTGANIVRDPIKCLTFQRKC